MNYIIPFLATLIILILVLTNWKDKPRPTLTIEVPEDHYKMNDRGFRNLLITVFVLAILMYAVYTVTK